MPSFFVTATGFTYTFPFTFGTAMEAVQVEDSPPVRAKEYRYLFQSFFMGMEPSVMVEGDDPTNPVWHQNYLPVLGLEYRYLLPSAFYERESTDIVEPDDPTNPIWHTNYLPVLPLDARHLLPNLFFQGDTADFIEPTDAAQESAWFQPIDRPVLGLEYRYSLPSTFFQYEPADFVVVDLTPEEHAWFQPVYQPVLPVVETRHGMPYLFQWLGLTVTAQGVVVWLPEREFTAELRPRTLEATLLAERKKYSG